MTRTREGFLTTGVLGKWGAECGVRCVFVNDKFYLLEGCETDGYRAIMLPEDLIKAASGEVCETAVKLYLESISCELFYESDGSNYKEFTPNGFANISDKQLLKEIRAIALKVGIKGGLCYCL